jgi:hypothetical protein
MRTWRVGTFSMGAALLFLGILLLFSKLLKLDMAVTMIAWWPVILIILGAEILIYLFVSKKENSFLKYDFVSIMFVGLIGTVGILFALLSSVGVFGKVETALAQEERSFELPEFSQVIDSNVKRVVIRTNGFPLAIESGAGRELSIFGTYTVQTVNGKEVVESTDDYLAVSQKGDTLYLSIKPMPSGSWPFDSFGRVTATLLVPAETKLDVIGQDSEITLRPRQLLANWRVDGVSEISLHLESNSDVQVTATAIQELRGNEDSWVREEGEEDTSSFNAVYKSGSGKQTIAISNAYRVSLTGGK